MSKWIGKFLRKEPHKRTDNTDKPREEGLLSVLSVPPQGYLDQNLENNPLLTTDGTDKPHNRGDLSVLSVPPQGVLDLDFENILEIRPDKPDRFKLDANMSGLSDPDDDLSGNMPFSFSDGPNFLDEYEERIAIAEYDGYQNPTQAKRIAYQDAFIAVLNTLPYEETEGDWFKHRIKAAQEWLFFQGLEQPE